LENNQKAMASLRALVTGASGFVGRHLVPALLADSWKVSALSRRREGCSQFTADCQVQIGDILDDGVLRSILASQRFDVIFHLAGLNPAGAAADLYRVNVLGTMVLLEAVRALGHPELKVVLLGSSAQYGDAKDDPITEESATGPVTNYGVSKACSDLMGKVLFKETGQHVLRARAFNIVGPGQGTTSLQGRVVEQIVEAERGRRRPVVETGDLTAYRDFVDVRDVAAGLIAIAKAGDAGEAYNLCSGNATQAKSLVDGLVALSTIPLAVKTVGRKAGVDVARQRGSFKKLQGLTNWAPAWTLEHSLQDALDYGRNNGAYSSGGAATIVGASRT
jgi:GDP-4-dehydro-6-deoxy-D-mannose reductase